MRQKDEHPFVAFYLLCGGVVLFVDCKKYDIKWISVEITNSLFCNKNDLFCKCNSSLVGEKGSK